MQIKQKNTTVEKSDNNNDLKSKIWKDFKETRKLKASTVMYRLNAQKMEQGRRVTVVGDQADSYYDPYLDDVPVT